MTAGILAFGGYIPRRRLQRAEIVRAHAWYNPALRRWSRGERAVAGWDEDSVTMAVEALRDCLGAAPAPDLAAVWLASTRMPFRDRLNAGIVADALQLPAGVATLDLASSMRAATSGLLAALAQGGARPVLLAASERRRARAASAAELTSGDGAAAVLAGQGDVIARFLGGRSDAVDFIDHFRGEDSQFDYAWEERWIRDEGHMKLIPATVRRLLDDTGVDPARIAHACLPTAEPATCLALARRLGIPEPSVLDSLQGRCGDTGAAHPLLMLAQALERAEPGDLVLLVGFGQGCDALLFETTAAIAQPGRRPARGVAGALAAGVADSNYMRYLSHNGLIEMDRGFRAEVDKPSAMSVHYRNHALAQGMVGGRCSACGTVQFPRANICVAPDCEAVGTQTPWSFAGMTGRLNSFTADALTFTPDPPGYYGMVQFDQGGRLLCDMSDIDQPADLHVGMALRMVFRVKDYDQRRDFRRYFWKAVPVATPRAQGERQ